ncbi:MAG: FliI/YscN family ATPase [Paracoccaceae bacterium]
MTDELIQGMAAALSDLSPMMQIGRVADVDGTVIWVTGLSRNAAIGDRLCLFLRDGHRVEGEVIRILNGRVAMLSESGVQGVTLGDRVGLLGRLRLRPGPHWQGRIMDPLGRPMDGHPLLPGAGQIPDRPSPPPAGTRRALGDRLNTGTNVFDTLLPIVRGQRIGLFAGSGVGKSSLLGTLARKMDADVVVLALVGERGRELRDFVENVLGPEGMQRSVVIAATSDRSPLERRQCLHTAMAVAEYFRDRGDHVLLLADSVTRFAEAHREVAIAAGELPALRGYPPSVSHEIMGLCERAGPGHDSAGDITAVLSVLVAGSDMDEPIADILRGVLDGHVVMDRAIAERGRYPAIDLLKSVSRSLPAAATQQENATLQTVKTLLGSYERSENMIRAGLYRRGSDPLLDQAISVWAELEAFMSDPNGSTATTAFARLNTILRRAGTQQTPTASPQHQGRQAATAPQRRAR